jgi:hypothetical protein
MISLASQAESDQPATAPTTQPAASLAMAQQKCNAAIGKARWEFLRTVIVGAPDGDRAQLTDGEVVSEAARSFQQRAIAADQQLVDDISAAIRAQQSDPNHGDDKPLIAALASAKSDLGVHRFWADIFAPQLHYGFVIQPIDPAVAAIPRRIVFVCQGGDAITPQMASPKTELTRAVKNLRPIQSTDIIIYENPKILTADDDLIICNSSNKRFLEHWIADLTPSGEADDPIAAITFALKRRPNLVYFLAESAKFADAPGLLDVFHKLNADHAIKVNTILFVDSKEEQAAQKDSEAVMKQIAEENGGHFRWVTTNELK